MLGQSTEPNRPYRVIQQRLLFIGIRFGINQ